MMDGDQVLAMGVLILLLIHTDTYLLRLLSNNNGT